MRQRFIFQIFLLMHFICFSSLAQRGSNLQDHLLIKESDKYLFGEAEELYEGSPYLADTFVMGYVYSGKTPLNGALMRYNIFSDRIEFRELGSTYVLAPDTLIERVEMGNYTLVVNLIAKNLSFLVLLEKGKLSLMAKSRVTYREKVVITDVPAKYSRSADMFFYELENKELMKVSTLKSFIAALPGNQEALIQFAKEEKISAKDKDDLIKLVRYYNALAVQ